MNTKDAIRIAHIRSSAVVSELDKLIEGLDEFSGNDFKTLMHLRDKLHQVAIVGGNYVQ